MFKVVIIDDEPWSREVVKALGQWAQMDMQIVGEADDGSAGLDVIGELEPDIVVTDMRMPGIDGTELLQEIGDLHPRMKIVVMSGFDDFQYLQQAIRSKAVEYLLKPINPEELNGALARCRDELQNESRVYSSMFVNRQAMQRYAEMRDRIYNSLLALDKERLKDAFVQMSKGLASIDVVEAGGSANARIASDLMLMLEQLLSEHDATLEGVLPSDGERVAVRMTGVSLRETVLTIGERFEQAVELLLDMRQTRARLEMVDVRAYIDAHYQDAISLETVAGQFLVSREHLSRMFKAWAGENLSDYIVRKRMEHARTLIMDERQSIKHAAQLSGYEDIAYFYRVFKKHFGVTPGELRKEG